MQTGDPRVFLIVNSIVTALQCHRSFVVAKCAPPQDDIDSASVAVILSESVSQDESKDLRQCSLVSLGLSDGGFYRTDSAMSRILLPVGEPSLFDEPRTSSKTRLGED